MAREIRPIDVTSIPDLLRIAEEVGKSGEARVLRRDHEDLALVVPINRGKRKAKRTKTPADYEAFKSAAGGWKDVDTERLLKDIYESRSISDRPPIDL